MTSFPPPETLRGDVLTAGRRPDVEVPASAKRHAWRPRAIPVSVYLVTRRAGYWPTAAGAGLVAIALLLDRLA
jgi:hypothetical protein